MRQKIGIGVFCHNKSGNTVLDTHLLALSLEYLFYELGEGWGEELAIGFWIIDVQSSTSGRIVLRASNLYKLASIRKGLRTKIFCDLYWLIKMQVKQIKMSTWFYNTILYIGTAHTYIKKLQAGAIPCCECPEPDQKTFQNFYNPSKCKLSSIKMARWNAVLPFCVYYYNFLPQFYFNETIKMLIWVGQSLKYENFAITIKTI